MWKSILAVALACSVQGSLSPASGAQSNLETKSFVFQPGDTLAINNDFGRIRIRPSSASDLEVQIRKQESPQAPNSALEVASQKSGSTLFIYSFFSGHPGEAVDLDIKAPGFANVMISGANPNIDIAGIQGFVRIQDLTGSITAEDLTSSASITTGRGNITYRANVQPLGDLRFESTSGNVRCQLGRGLNLRSWMRAGGTITWDKDPPLTATSLEKQMGTFGPLLYAGSLHGNVDISLRENEGAAASLTRPEEKAKYVSPGQAASEPAKQPAAEAASGSSQPQETRPEAMPAGGQQSAASQGTYSMKVNVDSVFLNASVRDPVTNRSIGGLRKDDFVVYEDGVRQQIVQFQSAEAPFNLLLLIDVSGSTESYLHLMKEAAIEFTREIKPNDRIAVATFNNGVQLAQGFTNDRSAAERAIDRIRSGGGTSFYDALMTCLDRYMRGLEGRSAVVIFTDGVDNQLEGRGGSITRFDELYREVQESDTIIYTIFLDTEGAMSTITRGSGRRYPGGGYPGGGYPYPGGRRGRLPGTTFPFPLPIPNPNPYPSPYPSPTPSPYPSPYPGSGRSEQAIYDTARQQLLDIAEQTGGRMYSPRRVEELSGVYSQIADDLRIQYQLGYNSTNLARDGRWRNIRVEVANYPQAVVRTRKGYYARKDDTRP